MLTFLQYYVFNLQLFAGDWFWWCLFVKIEDFSYTFYLDFLDYYVCVLQYYVKIMYMYAALNDSHYFFIFHQMLTATEQNMYFDF